jgi:flagellar basal-body rod protein FlgB
MTDSIFSDNAARAAKLALDGLSLQQQAISRNLANIDTPGYQAQTVNFEETLKRALDGGPTLAMNVTNDLHQVSAEQRLSFSSSLRPGGSYRADQNNVDIDVEMIGMSEAGIQYQAISQTISQKLLLLKNIAR